MAEACLRARKEALVEVGIAALGRLRRVGLTDSGAVPAAPARSERADGRLVAAAAGPTPPAADGDDDRSTGWDSAGPAGWSTTPWPWAW
ncbi:hypothetical protein [Streptomyces sp. TS71-3]|uniref:hypothetical protein n=1 Tax=Streptomyces sp. TS71-3 TaxID=2733862 RepID=UPI001B1A4F88|nr:hypothetical protein [Streptomyces sp. TS71-3]GHJ39071.1 hypothetical protein Sm713_46800 [Streptomyces sp. TS71-3]